MSERPPEALDLLARRRDLIARVLAVTEQLQREQPSVSLSMNTAQLRAMEHRVATLCDDAMAASLDRRHARKLAHAS